MLNHTKKILTFSGAGGGSGERWGGTTAATARAGTELRCCKARSAGRRSQAAAAAVQGVRGAKPARRRPAAMAKGARGAEPARQQLRGAARSRRGDGARQQLRGAAAAAHGGGGVRRTRKEGEGGLGLSEGDG